MSSKYYFVATVKGKDFVQGIPVYAFTEGDKMNQGWTSSSVASKEGFETLAGRISGARQLTLALPQVFALEKFQMKEQFSRMTIDAFSIYGKEKTYMFGISITTLLQDVKVFNRQRIDGWKGLPEPTGAQRKHLEESVQNWSLPYAVSLSVKDGMASVRN